MRTLIAALVLALVLAAPAIAGAGSLAGSLTAPVRGQPAEIFIHGPVAGAPLEIVVTVDPAAAAIVGCRATVAPRQHATCTVDGATASIRGDAVGEGATAYAHIDLAVRADAPAILVAAAAVNGGPPIDLSQAVRHPHALALPLVGAP